MQRRSGILPFASLVFVAVVQLVRRDGLRNGMWRRVAPFADVDVDA